MHTNNKKKGKIGNEDLKEREREDAKASPAACSLPLTEPVLLRRCWEGFDLTCGLREVLAFL